MRFIIAAFALILIPNASLAQENATAKAGKETRLGWIGSVGEGCKVNPAPKVTPKEVAGHGQIILREGQVRTKSVQGCPEVTVPAVVVFYKSSSDYTGEDGFTLSVTGTSAPSERRYTVQVVSSI